MGEFTTKGTPPGWPRISSAVYYEDPAAAIDWLCRAFGFTVRIKVEGEGGLIRYSELNFGGGLIMVSGAGEAYQSPSLPYRARQASPRMLGGKNTQSMCVYVDDVDAHCERARAAGATIDREPTTTDHGEEYWTDRSYGALDPEGHQWWFMQRLRNPKGAGE